MVANDPAGTLVFPGVAIAAWDPRFLLVIASLQKAEAKGHIPNTCVSVARWPYAPSSRAGSFPFAGFIPELFCCCFLVYGWKQKSGLLPLIFLIALLPAGGAGRFIADPVFWFCLLTSVLTLPSAIGNSVRGPEPGLQSFSPGKRFWSKLGGERATALSVLPYCNWVGCPCRWTGEMCSSSEGVQHTYVVLYISDFPTLLSHPSCPCIYLPPPQAGTSAKKKGDIRVSEPQSPLQERRWMEQISSGLLSRSRCRCWGQTPCQHLLWELSVRRVIFDAISCAGTKVFL